jgi:hypothetical protein
MVHIWPDYLTELCGTRLPLFAAPVIDDPEAARALRALHAALTGAATELERHERLAATARLLVRHAAARAPGHGSLAGTRVPAAAAGPVEGAPRLACHKRAHAAATKARTAAAGPARPAARGPLHRKFQASPGVFSGFAAGAARAIASQLGIKVYLKAT